jgi:hypothetical protein
MYHCNTVQRVQVHALHAKGFIVGNSCGPTITLTNLGWYPDHSGMKSMALNNFYCMKGDPARFLVHCMLDIIDGTEVQRCLIHAYKMKLFRAQHGEKITESIGIIMVDDVNRGTRPLDSARSLVAMLVL